MKLNKLLIIALCVNLCILLTSCLNITESSNKLSKWHGEYSYDISGPNPLTGDGPYVTTTFTISADNCTVDIEGYQADTHFNCYIEPVENQPAITIYNAEQNKKFGKISKRTDGSYIFLQYLINQISEEDSTYLLEKTN